MCGAPDNRAAQLSLTLALSRQRERELERRVKEFTLRFEAFHQAREWDGFADVVDSA